MIYKQMAWLEVAEEERKILHLKTDSGVWMPYTRFPQLRVPDNPLPGASKGYTTMQSLLKQGWKLVSSETAQEQAQLAATPV